jgi:hypothetical protein
MIVSMQKLCLGFPLPSEYPFAESLLVGYNPVHICLSLLINKVSHFPGILHHLSLASLGVFRVLTPSKIESEFMLKSSLLNFSVCCREFAEIVQS